MAVSFVLKSSESGLTFCTIIYRFSAVTWHMRKMAAALAMPPRVSERNRESYMFITVCSSLCSKLPQTAMLVIP